MEECNGKYQYQCHNTVNINDSCGYCDECKEKLGILNLNHYGKKLNYDKDVPCVKCGKRFKLEDAVITRTNNISKKCEYCFCMQKIIESKRPKRNRNWSKEWKKLKNDPERYKKKQQWKKDNPEKLVMYDYNHRKKELEVKGVKRYLKDNAKYAKKYRDEHPDKIKQINSRKKISYQVRCSYYKKRALNCGIPVELSDEQFYKLFDGICEYCGRKPDHTCLNGIDRVDNDLGYTINNCVSCCSLCNDMKCCMAAYVFIRRCQHIEKYISTKEKQWKILFPDHIARPYEDYMDRAENKQLEFLLTKDDYFKITHEPCYLCGKPYSNLNLNGIDRINNKKGYTLNNCKGCCYDCNIMKNDIDYIVFMNKILDITMHCIVNNLYAKYQIPSYFYATNQNCKYQKISHININKEVNQQQLNNTRIDNKPNNNLSKLDSETKRQHYNTYMKKYRELKGLTHSHYKKMTKEERKIKDAERKRVARAKLKQKYFDENTRKQCIEKVVNDRKQKVIKV